MRTFALANQNAPKMLAIDVEQPSMKANFRVPDLPPCIFFRFRCRYHYSQLSHIPTNRAIKIFPFVAQDSDCVFVPRISGLMNEADRVIAKRVRRVRFANDLTQSAFAAALNISLDRLASIEYGRTPLTVGLADKISGTFNINMIWLAEGDGTMTPCIGLNSHICHGIDGSELLSKSYNPDRKNLFLANYQNGLKEMDRIISSWPDVPKDKQIKLLDLVTDQFLFELGQAFAGLSVDGKDKLWNVMNEALRSYLEDWDNEQPNEKNRVSQKIRLTGGSPKGNSGGVQSEIQKLIEQVRRKASQPGAKADLARTLDVAPARITEWLSGKKEPGGDYALRLQKWVESPAHQK